MVTQTISPIADNNVKSKHVITEKNSSTLLIIIGIFVIVCLLVVIFKIIRCMNNDKDLEKYMDDSDDDNYRRNVDGMEIDYK